MQATKNHISLKTGELLRDCGVKSEYIFTYMDGRHKFMNRIEAEEIMDRLESPFGSLGKQEFISAYTWQEILWEYSEKFFGEDYDSMADWGTFDKTRHAEYILSLLQQKKYQEADDYFVEHCILTNK